MGATMPAVRAQHEGITGALPLLGEVPRTQQPRNGVASPWLVTLIAKALDAEFNRKEVADFLDTDKGNTSRILAGQQAFDLRKMDGRMSEAERERFARALLDELRRVFQMEDDATRLTRALDGLAASVNVIAEMARKGMR